jgi:hypothetical protein
MINLNEVTSTKIRDILVEKVEVVCLSENITDRCSDIGFCISIAISESIFFFWFSVTRSFYTANSSLF